MEWLFIFMKVILTIRALLLTRYFYKKRVPYKVFCSNGKGFGKIQNVFLEQTIERLLQGES